MVIRDEVKMAQPVPQTVILTLWILSILSCWKSGSVYVFVCVCIPVYQCCICMCDALCRCIFLFCQMCLYIRFPRLTVRMSSMVLKWCCSSVLQVEQHENEFKWGCVSASQSHGCRDPVRLYIFSYCPSLSLCVCMRSCLLHFDVNEGAMPGTTAGPLPISSARPGPHKAGFHTQPLLAWIQPYRQPAGLVCQVKHGSSVCVCVHCLGDMLSNSYLFYESKCEENAKQIFF